MANCEAHVVTGHQGTPHVSASDAGFFNAGIVGLERYVLNTSEKLRAEFSGNTVTIYPGDLVDQGRHINLPEISTIYIQNAPAGYTRYDAIVMHYARDLEGVETAQLQVIQGTPSQSDPGYPSISVGDIYSGDVFDNCDLYYVLANEAGIMSIETSAAFIVISPLSDIRGALKDNTIDITLATGSEQYAGWYYVDLPLPRNNPSAISVVSATSNRPAFVQLVNRGQARVYCNQANVAVTIRCLYCTL
ncbi:MAG: hypothetical protein IJ899_06610 [Blautia sp.]|nr:hypothetical protein [Blautia sp.]